MLPQGNGYWNGDEWRWRMRAPTSRPTISVIESTDASDDPPKNAHRVPFGFGVRDLPPEPEPLLWDGED